jgi:SAM-dependent methyltransferase
MDNGPVSFLENGAGCLGHADPSRSVPSMKSRFERIYDRNDWGYGSGEGSLESNTRPYRRFLQRFLRKHHIRSVVDLGCGDWQFSRWVDWTGIAYLGVDIAGLVIQRNQQLYACANIRFVEADLATYDLPPADLVLVKDVLQHWPNDLILGFLPKLERYMYALVTNCAVPTAPGQVVNADIDFGAFRPLNLNAPPFNLHLPEALQFTDNRGLLPFLRKPRWRKKVLLYTRDSARNP